ncbi:MAG: Hint domain-containing protein, partial [Marinibacterium sp.]|nr:Hint domain-containing protein [Marinibacterium sp.]
PQHRILIRSQVAERMFGTREALVPAKKLTGFPGIEVDAGTREVTYHHILLSNHELIFSNGAWTESLFTGAQSLRALSPDAVEEILALFPQIAAPNQTPPPARPIAHQGKRLATLSTRLIKNNKVLVEKTNG